MYSTLASIIKCVQPCMAKYQKSHFWLAHPEDVIFKKKVILQNTQGTIPVPLHYVEIGSKMQNFKPIHLIKEFEERRRKGSAIASHFRSHVFNKKELSSDRKLAIRESIFRPTILYDSE